MHFNKMKHYGGNYLCTNEISKQKKVFSSQMSSEKFKDQKSKGQERFTRVFLRVY